jgi:hypothetical protein
VLHSTAAASGTDITLAFGPAGARPIAGKWRFFSGDPQPVAGVLVPSGLSGSPGNHSEYNNPDTDGSGD